MTLGEYLKAAAATPWTPAVHDCSAWPARWAGIPLPDYSTDEEGEALIAEAGGLVPLWQKHIGERLQRVSIPLPGDVGVIRAISADGQADVGAIWTGRRWAFLTPKGLACASAELVAVWRVPCPKL